MTGREPIDHRVAVHDHGSGLTLGRNLTMVAAARLLLTRNGNRFEIRERVGSWWLWHFDGSENDPNWGHHHDGKWGDLWPINTVRAPTAEDAFALWSVQIVNHYLGRPDIEAVWEHEYDARIGVPERLL